MVKITPPVQFSTDSDQLFMIDSFL